MVWKIGTRVYNGGDYYLLLNIPPNASDDEIIKSFRRLALIFHSDKTHGCSETFMKLEEAKRILLDPTLRREYDRNRDNSNDPRLYCMFGSNTSKTCFGSSSLKCGFQLSQKLKQDLAKWRKIFKNLNVNGIDDNVESSLLNINCSTRIGLSELLSPCNQHPWRQLVRLKRLGIKKVLREFGKKSISNEDIRHLQEISATGVKKNKTKINQH